MLERFPPREAVELATLAEQHGFTGVMATDHFQPWTPQQGQASFVWNILSALGQTTVGDLGTGVTAPTFRSHPALTAQASATLAALYPGRHWLGIGSGEALNEHIAGQYWPEAPERIDRMFEAVDVIKKLFASGLAQRDVRHDGQYFKLESTRLWTMPERAPEILVATSGPVTARRAGRTVDGMITEVAPLDKIALLLQRFAEGAKEAGRDPKTQVRVLRLHLSWAPPTRRRWRRLAEWPNGGMRFGRSDIVRRSSSTSWRSWCVPMTSRADARHRRPRCAGRIQSFLDLGFDRIYLHNAGRNQAQWLEVFGRDVLPKLTR